MLPLLAAATMAPGMAGQMIKAGAITKGAGLLNQFGPSIGTAIGAMGPAGRDYRHELRSDSKAMQAGKLGYSDAQKNQMMAGANQQIQASQMAQQDAAQRMAAAGGFGNSAQSTQMMADSAKAAALGAANARAQIENASQQQALQRRMEIIARLKDQRDTAKADWARAFSKPVNPGQPYAKLMPDYSGLAQNFGAAGATNG